MFDDINPIDIGTFGDKKIRSLMQIAEQDSKVGNVLICISGLSQSGKSNTAETIVPALANRLKRQWFRTFKEEEFFKMSTDETRPNLIIEYDEIQNDIPSYWSNTYKRLNDIVQMFGYLHHIIVFITPDEKNLFRILPLCHILIKTERIYSEKAHKHFYIANAYEIKSGLKGMYLKPIENYTMPKVDIKQWNEYMVIKKDNWKIRKDNVATDKSLYAFCIILLVLLAFANYEIDRLKDMYNEKVMLWNNITFNNQDYIEFNPFGVK